MRMETRVVNVRDISADDARAWRALAAQALEPNPYVEPDTLSLCVKYFDGHADTQLVVS